jgi:hypothetical protein
MSSHTTQFSKEVKRFIAIAVVVAAVVLIVYSTCIWLGRCYAQFDSKIADINICLSETEYQPRSSFPNNVSQVYLCGHVEGTTPRTGGLYLFSHEDVIYTTEFAQSPGLFFQELPVEEIRIPGIYRVEIWYAKLLLNQTEFSVTVP